MGEAFTNQCSWMRKAERCSGLAEWRLGGAAEAAELCGAAELLGVPLTGRHFPTVYDISGSYHSKTMCHLQEHQESISSPFTPIHGT